MTLKGRTITADQVKLLIREGEGLTVEFKERYTSRIDQDIVAFANAKGGTLLLGVRDDGTMVGERVGMGIKRMRSAMREAGLKEPKFDTEGFFRAVFYRPERSKKRVGEEVGEKVRMKLTANQQRIIDAIRAAPSTSARELSTKVGISARKIEQNIAKLKQKGVLRRVGPARGGHWEVVR